MYFRDDGFVEAGSRFSEMPVQVPYGAEEYYNAVIDGIKASVEKDKEGDVPKPKKVKKTEPKKEVPPKKEEKVEYTSETLIELSKKASKKSSQGDVIAVYDEFGIANPKTAEGDALKGAIDKLLEMV